MLEYPLTSQENIYSGKDNNSIKSFTQILTLKQQDSEADTHALEAEIDRMVYELYGLSEEEIGVVEEAYRKLI